jgi:NTE family protein
MNEPATTRIALVMSGGNALGAFHAGAYEAMHEHGLRPSWIAGSSIGAVTGALIAGNPQERRIEMLKQFWNEASVPTMMAGQAGRYQAVAETRLFGRPHAFTPSLGFFARQPALYELAPLRATLMRLVDFDHLNNGATPRRSRNRPRKRRSCRVRHMQHQAAPRTCRSQQQLAGRF